MSRQSLLDTYFKSNKVSLSPSPCLPKPLMDNENKVVKKRPLSLIKPVTPSKIPKVKEEDQTDVIDLCSDDESSSSVKNEPVIENNGLDFDEIAASTSGKCTVDITPTASKPSTCVTIKNERVNEIGRPGLDDEYFTALYSSPTSKFSVPCTLDTLVKIEKKENEMKNLVSNYINDNATEKIDDLLSNILEDFKTVPITTELNDHSSTACMDVCQLKSQVTCPKQENEANFDSSQDTIVYSPPTTPQKPTCALQCTLQSPKLTLQSPHMHPSPQRVPQLSQCTPITPQHTPYTPKSPYGSPNSAKKYFSPVKKRAVSLKKNVRRNLAQNMEDSQRNELFDQACSGLDDKTIFLLTIVNKCVNNPSLFQLLGKEPQSLLTKCLHVVKPGMRLVCRLYWHKQGWYKIDKIKSILMGVSETIDDPTLQLALNSLQAYEFLKLGVSEGNELTFDELTSILNADDLKQICKELKLKVNSKQSAITALKEYSKEKSIASFFNAKNKNNAARVLKIMSSKAGPCYKLSELARKTIYDLYILMYLGIDYNLIRENKLELTLLYDKIKRETYPVDDDMLDDASVVFRERDEFERYLKAHNEYEEYLIEEDSTKKCEIVIKTFENFKNITDKEWSRCEALSTWLRRFTPMYIYVKILETGVQELKKASRFGLALEVLQALILQGSCRQHKKAEWYAEKALVLQKCNQSEKAALVLLEGFKSNIDEDAKDQMRPRAKIIAKKKGLNLDDDVRAELLEFATKEDILEKNLRGVHIYKQPMDRTEQRGKLKFETRSSGGRLVQDVEEYCLSHYISSGEFTDGLHCEGRLITTIFFLLFWDIIYWRPISCPGVFLTRFQRYPLDLFSAAFFANRREEAEARLALIARCSTDELEEILTAKWDERPEGEQSGLSREGLRLEHVVAASRCLGPGALAALSRRLLADYRYAHSGFPDLTVWNTRTNQIRFVEVKSDTDRPSMKQIQWMYYLQKHGIDAELCYVGVNTTRCRARPVS